MTLEAELASTPWCPSRCCLYPDADQVPGLLQYWPCQVGTCVPERAEHGPTDPSPPHTQGAQPWGAGAQGPPQTPRGPHALLSTWHLLLPMLLLPLRVK